VETLSIFWTSDGFAFSVAIDLPLGVVVGIRLGFDGCHLWWFSLHFSMPA
jgi:hypothetical protein